MANFSHYMTLVSYHEVCHLLVQPGTEQGFFSGHCVYVNCFLQCCMSYTYNCEVLLLNQ